MSGGVSEDIRRLTVVVSAVVPQGGSEFFGVLPGSALAGIDGTAR